MGWLPDFFSSTPRKADGLDTIFGFALMYLVVFALVTPPTPGWKFVRAGIVAPFVTAGFIWMPVYRLVKDWTDQWGTIVLFTFFAIRTLELLVFFPAEENVYRVVPTKEGVTITLPPKVPAELNGNGHGPAPKTNKTRTATRPETMTAEPVPPPWTFAKFCWANSLWWSWRGIGWNYASPLPNSSLQSPFTRNSTRTSYITHRVSEFIFKMTILDFVRAWMNCSSASAFFSGRPGSPTYVDLTQVQRAVYSMTQAIRTVTGMEISHIPVSIGMVAMGGMMGWEGELWSTWGWPPLFGTFGDVWRSPGLSQMWSKTWQQYFRRWLYLFGWIGIGEKVLRLPRTGPSANVPPLSSSSSSFYNPPTHTHTPGLTPTASGRTSPSHPLPTVPSSRPRRSSSLHIMLSNLIKSLCVFALSGAIHDFGTVIITTYTSPSLSLAKMRVSDMLVTTPFFISQPFALAVEAATKTTWRRWKGRHYPQWNQGQQEPEWLVFVERLVGFVWTWTWVGWTAGWYVGGLPRAGVFLRQDQPIYPSLFGGLIYGRWYH